MFLNDLTFFYRGAKWTRDSEDRIDFRIRYEEWFLSLDQASKLSRPPAGFWQPTWRGAVLGKLSKRGLRLLTQVSQNVKRATATGLFQNWIYAPFLESDLRSSGSGNTRWAAKAFVLFATTRETSGVPIFCFGDGLALAKRKFVKLSAFLNRDFVQDGVKLEPVAAGASASCRAQFWRDSVVFR